MNLTDLYLFMVLLPNLHEFATSPIVMLPVLLLVGGAVFGLCGTADGQESLTRMSVKAVRWGGGLLALLCCLHVLTPSHTQMYAIAGGYVATNTKEVKELPENLVGAANAWLKKAAELAETAEPESKSKKR